MNNTNKLLTTSTIIALLLMGTSVIPMQSYAGGSDQQQKHKDTSDLKQSIQKDTQSAKANQHLDEENFCYRGDDCQQANQGQQIVGKDNDAAGVQRPKRQHPTTHIHFSLKPILKHHHHKSSKPTNHNSRRTKCNNNHRQFHMQASH